MSLRAEDRIELSELIPHRGDSLLLDGIVDHDAGSTTARVVVGKPRCLLREDGTVPTWLVVEYMAQTIAVHEGFIARSEGRNLELGFLVTVVGLSFAPVVLSSGDELEVKVQRVRGRPGLGVVSHVCSAHRRAADGRDEVVADGRLSIAIKGLRVGGLVDPVAGATDTPAAKRRGERV
jgi:predicted hotdog family 3-hydroxylacyl-ACP dehydratase